jgi:hypothetical protein
MLILKIVLFALFHYSFYCFSLQFGFQLIFYKSFPKNYLKILPIHILCLLFMIHFNHYNLHISLRYIYKVLKFHLLLHILFRLFILTKFLFQLNYQYSILISFYCKFIKHLAENVHILWF